jgi:hypothetical protein
MEGQPQIARWDYEALLEENRELYSEPPMIPEDMPLPTRVTRLESKPQLRIEHKEPLREEPIQEYEEPITFNNTHYLDAPTPKIDEPKPKDEVSKPKKQASTAPKDLPQPGRGGRQHKYLQQLIKQLAEERGFRATIEETILDGAGRVDISLVRDKIRVAFQVSVTTTKDWELGGIEKCLASGYTEVVLVGSTERHVKALSKFVEENLDPKDQGRVRYITSDGVIGFLDSLGVPVPTEKVVRGYKVRTVQQPTDSDDAAARRKAISEVIAKSLQRGAKE